jgi:hypothetical protein
MSPYNKALKFVKIASAFNPGFPKRRVKTRELRYSRHCAASSGNSFTDISGQSIGPIFKGP